MIKHNANFFSLYYYTHHFIRYTYLINLNKTYLTSQSHGSKSMHLGMKT